MRVVLGDARISMQRELDETGSNEFDILVLDAFSGDSIPVHLLTEEAFDLYADNLREGGIIAVHITNLFVDLLKGDSKSHIADCRNTQLRALSD